MRHGGAFLVIFLVLLLALGGAFFLLYKSPLFEQNKPTIEVGDKLYWNLKEPLKIVAKDDVGIQHYKVALRDGSQTTVLENQTLQTPQNNLELIIKAPKLGIFSKGNKLSLIIEIADSSKWNFFAGNSVKKEVEVVLDSNKPLITMLSNSYSISRGGSGLVIFKATDESLKDVFIETTANNFIPQPFYKQGQYFISLIAWPVTDNKFSASVVATDYAGNKSVVPIKFFLKDKKYKDSNIELKDTFLDGKITELLAELGTKEQFSINTDKFKYVNETIRQANEDLIAKLSRDFNKNEPITSFTISPFYPLKNGAVVAHFGDHRFFYYNKNLISESWHLGIDLASTQAAKINSNNRSRVTFIDFNGIYGNMVLLYHGLGLSTLYGHCTTVYVKKDEEIAPNTIIADTGKSGLALGDHLHFGVLVQGVEVRPEEWMDKDWIKLNVVDIIEDAKKLLNSRETL